MKDADEFKILLLFYYINIQDQNYFTIVFASIYKDQIYYTDYKEVKSFKH